LFKTKEGENFNHRNTLSILRINSPKFGGGLKFEPVDKSRSAGTPELGKIGRFAKVSVLTSQGTGIYHPTLKT